MTRVRMTTDQAARGMYRRNGQEYDVPDDEARRLIAGGSARPVETAAIAPPENAARPSARPRRPKP